MLMSTTLIRVVMLSCDNENNFKNPGGTQDRHVSIVALVVNKLIIASALNETCS